MTLSKERLEHIAGLADRCGADQILGFVAEEVSAMATELLERRERDGQEPVAYTSSNALADVYCGDTSMMGPADTVGDVPLYAAPPAPVSVTEWTNEQCLEFLSIAFRHAEIKGDLELDDIRLGVKMANGSGAAMLKGGKQ